MSVVAATRDPSAPLKDAAVDESRWAASPRIPLCNAPHRTWRPLANANDSNYALLKKMQHLVLMRRALRCGREHLQGRSHGAADGFSRCRDHRRRSALRVSVPQAVGGPRWSGASTFREMLSVFLLVSGAARTCTEARQSQLVLPLGAEL